MAAQAPALGRRPRHFDLAPGSPVGRQHYLQQRIAGHRRLGHLSSPTGAARSRSGSAGSSSASAGSGRPASATAAACSGAACSTRSRRCCEIAQRSGRCGGAGVRAGRPQWHRLRRAGRRALAHRGQPALLRLDGAAGARRGTSRCSRCTPTPAPAACRPRRRRRSGGVHRQGHRLRPARDHGGDTPSWLRDATIADVPQPGEHIPRGRPICTVFASAKRVGACRHALATKAATIYHAVESGGARGRMTPMPPSLAWAAAVAATISPCWCATAASWISRRPARVARQWFGDGTVPAEIQVAGPPASIEQAIEKAAALLSGARRPAVLIAPDLTTQAQRIAIAAADSLRAEVDGATSEAAAAGLLAAQRRGRCGGNAGRNPEPGRRDPVLGCGSAVSAIPATWSATPAAGSPPCRAADRSSPCRSARTAGPQGPSSRPSSGRPRKSTPSP